MTIGGTITVSPMGRTQAEKRYILETVLEHLPVLQNVEVYVIQKNDVNIYSSHNEFGVLGRRLGRDIRIQEEYILAVDGYFSRGKSKEAYRDFIKWLIRLSKRVTVNDVKVVIGSYVINTRSFRRLFEYPSWSNGTGEPTWCEYLMWDSMKNADFPMTLGYKYYADKENDEEVERRVNWRDH